MKQRLGFISAMALGLLLGWVAVYTAWGSGIQAIVAPAAAVGGLSVSGYYLTDGSNYYVGPLFNATCTRPSAGTYSWVNQGTATETATGGALVMVAPAHSGGSLRLRTASIGVTTTLVASFACTYPNVNFGNCFVGLYESGSGKVEVFGPSTSAASGGVNGAVVSKWNSTTSFNTFLYNQNISPYGVWSNILWEKITVGGGNLTYYISNDGGSTYLQVYTEASNAFFSVAPDNWMYGLDMESTSFTNVVTLLSWLTS